MKGVIFVSRNKDNENVKDFKQRKISFLTDKSLDELKEEFDTFVSSGVKDELSRFYISVNERKNESTIKDLQHYLLDHPTFSVTKLESKVTSLAMQPQNAAEHKWLFDYDSSEDLDHFVEDLILEGFKENEIEIHKTVHNYAVIVPHGFDSRRILAKYKDCELKRDASLCVSWKVKSEMNLEIDNQTFMSVYHEYLAQGGTEKDFKEKLATYINQAISDEFERVLGRRKLSEFLKGVK